MYKVKSFELKIQSKYFFSANSDITYDDRYHKKNFFGLNKLSTCRFRFHRQTKVNFPPSSLSDVQQVTIRFICACDKILE